MRTTCMIALAMYSCLAGRAVSAQVPEYSDDEVKAQFVNAAVFSATGRDWGQETSRGFYPSGEHVRSILSEMLMYGVDVGESLDIPNGTVYSLRKNATTPRQTFSSKVGAEFIITDITEVYSR